MEEIELEIYETASGKRPFEEGSQEKDIAKAREYLKDYQSRGNYGKK